MYEFNEKTVCIIVESVFILRWKNNLIKELSTLFTAYINMKNTKGNAMINAVICCVENGNRVN